MPKLVSVQTLARALEPAQGKSLVHEVRRVEKGLELTRGVVPNMPPHIGLRLAADHAVAATRVLSRAESASAGRTAQSFGQLAESGTEFAHALSQLGAGANRVRVKNPDAVLAWMNTMRELTGELVQPRIRDTSPLLDQIARADTSRLRAIAGLG